MDVPVIGETWGEIPPSRSTSASWRDVLSSKSVSPPNRAPRKTPSGCKASLICTRTPGKSLTQCKLRQDTIASCELGRTVCSRFSSSATIRSTLTVKAIVKNDEKIEQRCKYTLEF